MSAAAGKKYVYLFEEGRAEQKRLLGGKGANLAEMTNIGLPVPPGFTISTEACIAYYEAGGRFPDGLEEQIFERLAVVEKKTGKRFGDPENPLLVSVRSGAMFSMPGMMDTILNLGLNDETVQGLAARSGDPRFAYDCYRRFIQMFGNVVLRMKHGRFDDIITTRKKKVGVEFDHELDADALRGIIQAYVALIREETGEAFPQDPRRQLLLAIKAVFASWNNDRAVTYRNINKLPHDLGTAVNIQTMVFGNLGPDSATGVLFTRDPSTGEPGMYGEYLINAQGEDVVAGIRTPRPAEGLKEEMPRIYEELVQLCETLERHYSEMQDIEFTVEEGRLYVLQTRLGKRTAAAAIRIAVDLVNEGIIPKAEAVMRVEPDQVSRLLHRGIDPKAELEVVAKGLPASPGAASGQVVFDADEAEQWASGNGTRIILVRPETTPDDIHGIVAAQGVLTSRGGMTCHAAIVARHMGKPCVVGCESLRIDLDRKVFTVGDRTVRQGDLVSIDGATGRVILGEVPLVEPTIGKEFRTLLGWADEYRRLGVRANADTPGDARRARDFGAQGIGLCRTEHMFMAPDRIAVVQRMILAETEVERRRALEELLPMQEGDFVGILEAMAGLPVTIRLLDPPLHEFLPHRDELLVKVTELRAARGGKGGGTARGGDGQTAGDGPADGDGQAAGDELEEAERLLTRVNSLTEFNPMMGHRGVRVGVAYPEIYEMQARAIFRAAARLVKEGVDARPEVMIPLVGIEEELLVMREMCVRVAEETMSEFGVRFHYLVGTMIEVPRACVVADEIARHADFFSFGTNDLTQMTFGFSRDDAEGKFLGYYLDNKLLAVNPFEVLDPGGVGKLMEMAVLLGRRDKEDLKIGICGEHGGEPSSVEFCHGAGLDYVSCSPFRVPVARLAAARAMIKEERERTGKPLRDERGER